MRLIKCLSHYMEDEICGCIKYAKDALEYQYSKPNMAKIFFQMAQTEYAHYQTLHEQVVKLIDEIQEQKREYPQKMYNQWDCKHRELIEKAEIAMTYLGMFK